MQRFLFAVLRKPMGHGLLWLFLACAVQATERTILVLGDSISAAYGMSLQEGWVALMEERLEQEYPQFRVVNASISGETTGGGLRRLPDLLEEHGPDLVIIELGGNDGLRGFPLNQLSSNLTSMASLSRESGAEVVLLPMEIPPNYGSRYTEGFRRSFEKAATQTGSTLGPFILDGVATTPGLMQPDGIHPTVEAQAVLLDNVLPTVIEALGRL
jgi:acyl-CoA thioesterase-1